MDFARDCHSKRAFAARVMWFVLQRRGTLPVAALRDHVLAVSPWRCEIEPDALACNTFERACARRHEVLVAAIAAGTSAMHALDNLSFLLEENPFDPSSRRRYSEVYETCFDVLRESVGEFLEEDVDRLKHAMSRSMRELDHDAVKELLAC